MALIHLHCTFQSKIINLSVCFYGKIYVYITLKSIFDSRWVSDDVSVTSGCINETTTDEAPPLSRVQWDSWASAGVCLLRDRTYVRVVTRRPAARFMLR